MGGGKRTLNSFRFAIDENVYNARDVVKSPFRAGTRKADRGRSFFTKQLSA
jgi:hypothetical protein